MAALLSFFFPGLGQIANGQPLKGIFIMLIIIPAYLCFVVPGLIVHIAAVWDAAYYARQRAQGQSQSQTTVVQVVQAPAAPPEAIPAE